MNKIFKTKFNVALNVWTAVSEFALNKGKTGSTVSSNISAESQIGSSIYLRITALATAISMSLFVPVAMSAISISSTKNNMLLSA